MNWAGMTQEAGAADHNMDSVTNGTEPGEAEVVMVLKSCSWSHWL